MSRDLTLRDLHDQLCEADCEDVVDAPTEACDVWNCLRDARCQGLEEAITEVMLKAGHGTTETVAAIRAIRKRFG